MRNVNDPAEVQAKTCGICYSLTMRNVNELVDAEGRTYSTLFINYEECK